MTQHLLRFVLFAVGLPAALQAGAVLTLEPSTGALTGLPGQTVGWGFTVTNDTDYLVVSGVEFVTLSPAGVFTDYASDNFLVVGPAPEQNTITQVLTRWR